MLAHLSGDVRKHKVAVGQLNAEHRVGQSLDDRTLDLNDPFFFGHIVRLPLLPAESRGLSVLSVQPVDAKIRFPALTAARHPHCDQRDSALE